MNYLPLSQAAQIIYAKSVDENGKSLRRDYEVALGEFVSNMENIFTVNSPTGELKFSKHGFGQLVRDRLGLPPAIFDRSDVKNSTKLAILRDVAGNGHANDVVKVRVAGSQVQAVVSQDYSFFDNLDLMASLERLRQKGSLPEATYVMNKDFLSSDGRGLHLRLVSPDNWDFVIPEPFRQQPYHGNLILSNNEIAQGSFQAKAAITRTSCLNSTVGQSLFAVTHKFADYSTFTAQLDAAVGKIGSYAREMGEYLRNTQNINVKAPMVIFERIQQELGIPKYAMDRSTLYWEQEGSRDSLYDIIQSVAAGTREVTIQQGRRQPNWEVRTMLESKLWGLSNELQNIHLEGNSIEQWYLVGESAMKYRIVELIRGYEPITPVASEIASRVEEL